MLFNLIPIEASNISIPITDAQKQQFDELVKKEYQKVLDEIRRSVKNGQIEKQYSESMINTDEDIQQDLDFYDFFFQNINEIEAVQQFRNDIKFF